MNIYTSPVDYRPILLNCGFGKKYIFEPILFMRLDNEVVVASRCYDIFKRIIELGVQKCTEYVCLEELRYIIRETISAFSETLQKVKIKFRKKYINDLLYTYSSKGIEGVDYLNIMTIKAISDILKGLSDYKREHSK